MTGFEALVRWRHPERGLISPIEFIGLAEETGFIVPIGAWVLETACAQLARWHALRRGGGRLLTVSTNLSPRQLAEPTLIEQVSRVVHDSGVPPDTVWLEITETALMHDTESATSALRALRGLGVHLAVDDFGTGYSSLSHLKRFPIEALKIDQTFVAGLVRGPEDAAIVTAVVSLAHALGLSSTAEGVETLGAARRAADPRLRARPGAPVRAAATARRPDRRPGRLARDLGPPPRRLTGAPREPRPVRLSAGRRRLGRARG